ncbi:hypothetical protein [Acetobacter senegalensis]|uniref:hypothetical protein n=1 Tax=Acetobacter senegalensis TaxID=446692 RepID=UPI001EDD0B04|nr:hypothetical protein [Acetobacter senegalensis]MCG4274641.1 hypothetical protein [Acetobacter senegalensis]
MQTPEKQRAGQVEREGSGRLFCEDDRSLSLTTRAGKRLLAGWILRFSGVDQSGAEPNRPVKRKRVFVFFLAVRAHFISVCAGRMVRSHVITQISDMRFLDKST